MKVGSEHLERISEVLEHLEADLAAGGETLGEHVRGIELVIRILAAVIGILALANLYFVNDLTQEVKGMIAAMNKMTTHFSDVARHMDGIRGTVTQMGQTVAMMPIMAEQMGEISADVVTMSGDVGRMRGITVAIDQGLDTLNRDTREMAGRFHSLNRIVRGMGADVDQISRPVP